MEGAPKLFCVGVKENHPRLFLCFFSFCFFCFVSRSPRATPSPPGDAKTTASRKGKRRVRHQLEEKKDEGKSIKKYGWMDDITCKRVSGPPAEGDGGTHK